MTQEEVIALQDLDDTFVLAKAAAAKEEFVEDLVKDLDTKQTDVQAYLRPLMFIFRFVHFYAVKFIEIYQKSLITQKQCFAIKKEV